MPCLGNAGKPRFLGTDLELNPATMVQAFILHLGTGFVERRAHTRFEMGHSRGRRHISASNDPRRLQ